MQGYFRKETFPKWTILLIFANSFISVIKLSSSMEVGGLEVKNSDLHPSTKSRKFWKANMKDLLIDATVET